MNFGDKKRILLISLLWAVLFVFSGFMFLYLIRPQKAEIVNLRERIKEQQLYHQMGEDAQNTATKVKAEKILEDLQNTFNDFAIEADQAESVIFHIREIAEQVKVKDYTIRHLDLDMGKAKGEQAEITERRLSVSFTAEFPAFLSFVNKIEMNTPIIFIDRFDISKKQMQGSSNNVNLALFFYVMNEK
ncbi:MAG: GspMb/PilO family protein [Planctomycetota bacterium]